MFNHLFIGKSGKEFIGRVIEKESLFIGQIFNERNEKIFQSRHFEKPDQANRVMVFNFSTIRNDI